MKPCNGISYLFKVELDDLITKARRRGKKSKLKTVVANSALAWKTSI
jgi:hypothetical protein